VFLIIESDSELPLRVQQWLGHFHQYCTTKEESLSWKTKVKMLELCPAK